MVTKILRKTPGKSLSYFCSALVWVSALHEGISLGNWESLVSVVWWVAFCGTYLTFKHKGNLNMSKNHTRRVSTSTPSEKPVRVRTYKLYWTPVHDKRINMRSFTHYNDLKEYFNVEVPAGSTYQVIKVEEVTTTELLDNGKKV